jgi:Flp pilus assembly protein TadD
MRFASLDAEELLRLCLDAINNDRHADAVEMLKTLLDRDPDHVFATYLLAAEHAQLGMMDRAEAGFRRTVELAPAFEIGRFQLAQALLVRGDEDGARQALDPLTASGTEGALPHYARALLATCDEDLPRALEALDAGLAMPQEIPALAEDMRRLRAELGAATGAIAPAAAPSMFLSAYGKSAG